MLTATNEPGVRGPAVTKIVNISYRQLDYWARTDLVRPSVEDGSGSGFIRLYSFEDVFHLCLIKQLLDSGMKLPVVREVFAAIRKVGDCAGMHILVDHTRNRVEVIGGSQLAATLEHAGGVATVLSMAVVVDGFRERMRVHHLALPEEWDRR